MQNSRKLVRLIAFMSIIFTFVVLIAAVDGQAQENVSTRKFEFGAFAQGGFPPNYKIYFTNETLTEKLQIYSAGIEVGMLTRRLIGPGLLKGQGEALMEVVPFWLARYPPQNQTFTISGGGTTITKTAYWSGENIPGASVTPFLLRWNFDEHAHQKVVPWVQLGGGLLWTNHEFPLYFAPTSSVNFTPQVGAGINIFTHPNRSVNLGFKFIHISNAGLGDNNPAIHDSLNFSAGYSWWK
jgi:hypothetical protein